LSLATDKY